MSIAIIDIDNCIADDRHRRCLIDMNHQDMDKRFKAYHEAAHLDQPCNNDIIERHLENDDTLMFVTSRPWRYRKLTRDWLEAHFNIPASSILLMRPDGNRDPSYVLKPTLVLAAGVDVNDVCAAYDDRFSVLDAYREIGIENCVHVDAVAVASEVPQILRQAATIFEQRNAMYGNAYKRHGNIMMAMFPDGLTLNDSDDWTRFGVFVMCVSKLNRYASNLKNGGHKDSAHDLSVFAAMLEELTK